MKEEKPDGLVLKTALRRSLTLFSLGQPRSPIARSRQSESVFFPVFLGSGFDSYGRIQEYVVNLSALALVKIPWRLWHLVFSLVSSALASFHLFVILHGYYHRNWKKGILGLASLP